MYSVRYKFLTQSVSHIYAYRNLHYIHYIALYWLMTHQSSAVIRLSGADITPKCYSSI